MNLVVLLGRVGQDPEIRTTSGGMTIANLSLATSERVKKDGQWVEDTAWHRLVLFGKTAETAEKYVHKGDLLSIQGRLQYRKWEKDGVTRYATEIVVDRMHFAGGKKSERRDDEDEPSTGGRQPEQQPYDDSEIPF